MERPGNTVDFAGWLGVQRRRAGLTQEELADRAGLSVRTVRNWERGAIATPQSASLRQVSVALGLGAAEVRERVYPDRISAAGPCQLPRDTPDFVGRVDECERLTQVLTGKSDVAVPIAVIFGRSGVGKTTLATRLGHSLRSVFTGGQLFVSVRVADRRPLEPLEVLAGFLRALGVESPLIPRTLPEREAMFRMLASQRRLLVVVDDADSAAQVRSLVPGAPGCAVLVTARARLDAIEGAYHLGLPAFDEVDGADLLGQIAGAQRVAAEPEAARAVVRYCEGLPLAVRIAGVRLTQRHHRPVAWLADLLSNEGRRLDELTADDLAMKTTLSVTYQRLSARERLLLRHLSLIDAAYLPSWLSAPCAGGPAEPVDAALDALVRAGLLELDDHTATSDTVGFRMHGLVRAFARTQSDSEDSVQARRDAVVTALGVALRLVDIATATPLTEFAAPSASPAGRCRAMEAAEQDAAADPIEWLEHHRQTLVALILQACDLGLLDHAWALAELLFPFLDLRAHYDDIALTHSRLHGAATAAGHAAAEAQALQGLFEIDALTSAQATAVDRLRTATDICHRLGLRRKALALEANQAIMERQLGRSEDAHRRAVAMLRASEDIDDPMLHALGLQTAAMTLLDTDPIQAAAMLRSARRIYRRQGCTSAESHVVYRLAEIHRAAGNTRAARAYLIRALETANALQNPLAVTAISVSFAELEADDGAYPQAEEVLLWCRASFQRLGRYAGLARAELALAKLYLTVGDLGNARTALRSAREAAHARTYSPVLREIDHLIATDDRCAQWLGHSPAGSGGSNAGRPTH